MPSPINEARALLSQFARSPLRDLYWRGPEWSVFMAREGGAANPMREAAQAESAAPLAASAPSAPTHVTAPHLGLFDPRCVLGQMVERNGLIGVIDVLGRMTEVFSATAGQVVAVRARADDLVEFGDTLVEIAEAA